MSYETEVMLRIAQVDLWFLLVHFLDLCHVTNLTGNGPCKLIGTKVQLDQVL